MTLLLRAGAGADAGVESLFGHGEAIDFEAIQVGVRQLSALTSIGPRLLRSIPPGCPSRA